MIQPDIALAVRTPLVDNPLETAGKAMGLVNMRQQQAANQQHLAAGALSLQEAQLKQQDDQKNSAAWQASDGDPDKHIALFGKSGARPQAVQALQKHYADIREQKAKTSKDEGEAQKLEDDKMSGLVQGLMQVPDEQYPAAYQQAVVAAKQINPKLQLPDQAPPKDALGHIALAYKTNTILDAQAASARAQKEEERKAAKAPAELAKAEADATTAQQTAAGTSPIQPEQQARIDLQKRGLEQTAEHNAATERNAAALLQVSRGHLAVSQQQADIAKQVYEQTYGAGANPALAGVEPKLRKDAADKAQKAADEWHKATESTGNMQSIIDLARKGNKVAYAYAPTTGVLTINTANGVKRVNMAEIKSYAGAGSAVDKIEGWVKGKLTGESIPANILQAMEDVNKSIADNSSKNYDASLDSINQNFRSNFKRVGGAQAPAAAGGHVIEISGKHYRYKGSGPTDSMDSYSEVK